MTRIAVIDFETTGLSPAVGDQSLPADTHRALTRN
jgi:hypothetical protein